MDRIRITAAVAAKLKAYHLDPQKHVEAVSFAYATAVETDGELLIVLADPDDVLLLAPDCYSSCGATHVSVPADVRAGFIIGGIRRGWKTLVLVDIHDHFFSFEAKFSTTDDRDDIRTAVQINKHIGRYVQERQRVISVSLLLSQHQWSARRVVWGEDRKAKFSPLLVDVLGEKFERHGVFDAIPEPWTIRQSALISAKQSASIKSMRICIVGGGGTGSIAFEAACRLGFSSIDVIDQDQIEISNLNRFHGASARDIGKLKAEFLVTRGIDLFPDGKYRAINNDAFSEVALKSLTSSDIIIGCVDNSETRWYLNRIAVQFAIPYFDCGNLIQLEPELILHSRVNAVIPGLTRCGHCSDIEFMPRKVPDSFVEISTLLAQRQAGYVQNQTAELPAPSMYPLNLQSVSWLMNELLNWMCARSFAHSVYHRSDRKSIERLDRENYSVGPADDCPVCSTLIGKCFETKLPQRGGEVSLFNDNPDMEINHG